MPLVVFGRTCSRLDGETGCGRGSRTVSVRCRDFDLPLENLRPSGVNTALMRGISDSQTLTDASGGEWLYKSQEDFAGRGFDIAEYSAVAEETAHKIGAALGVPMSPW